MRREKEERNRKRRERLKKGRDDTAMIKVDVLKKEITKRNEKGVENNEREGE